MDLFDYDAELRRHTAHFFAAAKVGAGDRVLDIGCGTGQTTREAARAAVDGVAVGVDISEVMLEQARRISDDEELSNISFELADAQVNPFPPTSFDLCISRFGVMFFADPVAAFTNIARALRPGGRLAGWSGKGTTTTNGHRCSVRFSPPQSPRRVAARFHSPTLPPPNPC